MYVWCSPPSSLVCRSLGDLAESTALRVARVTVAVVVSVFKASFVVAPDLRSTGCVRVGWRVNDVLEEVVERRWCKFLHRRDLLSRIACFNAITRYLSSLVRLICHHSVLCLIILFLIGRMAFRCSSVVSLFCASTYVRAKSESTGSESSSMATPLMLMVM